MPLHREDQPVDHDPDSIPPHVKSNYVDCAPVGVRRPRRPLPSPQHDRRAAG